jgi:hypothetical protein
MRPLLSSCESLVSRALPSAATPSNSTFVESALLPALFAASSRSPFPFQGVSRNASTSSRKPRRFHRSQRASLASRRALLCLHRARHRRQGAGPLQRLLRRCPDHRRFSYDTDIVLSQYLGGFVAFATEPNAKIEFNVKIAGIPFEPEGKHYAISLQGELPQAPTKSVVDGFEIIVSGFSSPYFALLLTDASHETFPPGTIPTLAAVDPIAMLAKTRAQQFYPTIFYG